MQGVYGWPTICRNCGERFEERWLHRFGAEPVYHEREVGWPYEEHCWQVCNECMDRTNIAAIWLLRMAITLEV